jgi:hypothetical protein
MGRVANPELAALWRARVARQQQSGLSVAEFCRREDCTPAAFHAWRRRLGSARMGRVLASEELQRRGKAPLRPGSDFVRIPLAVTAAIEVRFANGTVVSLPSNDLAALAVALRALQSSQQEEAADD